MILESFAIIWIVNSEVYCSIVCEKPDLRLNVFREIIYVEQEEEWDED